MTTMNREKNEAPTIQTADDLLAKMRAGKKELHEIRMGEVKIPVRVLSIDESNRIRRDAIMNTAKMGGDEVDRNILMQRNTLALASTSSEGAIPMLSEKVLGKMSVDEINYLYNEYVRAMDTVNPSLETIQPDQWRVIVEAIKKNEISSKDCSLPLLRAIFTAYQDLIQRPVSQTSPRGN